MDYKLKRSVNEYGLFTNIGASGALLADLQKLEDYDIGGCMAYWGMASSLNEIAADQNSPVSTWWEYC